MNAYRQNVLLLIALFTSMCLIGQDVHFSQIFKAPLQLNPALTANSKWDVRMGANWRQQWVKVPVNYQTFGGFYDQKISLKSRSNGYLGVGASFMHDQAGDSELSWSQLGLRVAFHLPLDDELLLSAGIAVDAGQRAFRSDQLQFSDQYNGELFDPDQLTAEQFAQQSSAYVSQSAGINLKRQYWKSRSFLQVGFSLSHLNQPEIRFFDENVLKLPMLISSYTNGLFELSKEWDVTVQAFWGQQGPYNELMLGGGARYHLDWKGEDIMFGAGLKYRLNDAFIIQLEGGYQQWHWGVSYDINTSGFSVATQGRGGLEVAIHYYLLQVKPPDEFKSCPVF